MNNKAKSIDDIHYLSPEELEAVKEGIWQIGNGLFISHEEANRRVEEALQKYDSKLDNES